MVGKGISLLECTTFVRQCTCWGRTYHGFDLLQGGEAAAFIRSDDPSLFPEEKIVAPGPSDRPDIEIFSCPVGIRNGVVIPSPPGDLMSLSTILLRPTSQGTIKLHSLDPFDPPLIDPKFVNQFLSRCKVAYFLP
jgi:choline dehydrogenase